MVGQFVIQQQSTGIGDSMRARILISALFLLGLLRLAATDAKETEHPSPPPLPIAFLHVNVIPMDREKVVEDQTVVTQGGRIVQIGDFRTVKVPPKARRIDAKGKYLIPGLADAHVHLQSRVEFALYLANGVTTVFNLDGRPGHLLWRHQVAAGTVSGPTIFSTGPIFHQKRTPEEDVQLVDAQAAAGYDAIKVYNEVSKEEYPALISEARSKNLLLMGHVARGPGFEMTLQSGQSIAHLEEIMYTYFNPQHDDEFDHIVFDESKIPVVTRMVKDSGIYVTATLDNFSRIVLEATDLDAFLKNPELNYVAPWTLLQFEPPNNRYKNRFGPDKYAVLENLLAFQRKLLKSFSDAGVPLMAGTDATEVGPVAGFGLHHELQEFVNDGLTPYQALQTATTNVAKYLRQSDEFGAIEAGKHADMVLLSANPLANIANTKSIGGVMVRGYWLDRAQLDEMLSKVQPGYEREKQKMDKMLAADPAGFSKYVEDNDPLGRLAAYTISEMAAKEDIAVVIRLLKTLRRNNPDAALVSEDNINNLGYGLMDLRLFSQAVTVLRFNAEQFPKSANVWDSLADAYFHSGDIPDAVENYKKALQIDSSYSNAEEARKFIASHSEK
jgi:tetratricopeptide (TPR) repeat protein